MTCGACGKPIDFWDEANLHGKHSYCKTCYDLKLAEEEEEEPEETPEQYRASIEEDEYREAHYENREREEGL